MTPTPQPTNPRDRALQDATLLLSEHFSDCVIVVQAPDGGNGERHIAVSNYGNAAAGIGLLAIAFDHMKKQITQ